MLYALVQVRPTDALHRTSLINFHVIAGGGGYTSNDSISHFRRSRKVKGGCLLTIKSCDIAPFHVIRGEFGRAIYDDRKAVDVRSPSLHCL